MFKQFAAQYFTFSKKERMGIISLLIGIVLFTILPFFYPLLSGKSKQTDIALTNELAALKEKPVNQEYANNQYSKSYSNYQPNQRYYEKATAPQGELFAFDPNTLNAAGWKRLGLRDKTITTIQNYLSKGGHFYQPEDIRKIWGLHPDELERLLPYVSIAQTTRSYGSNNTTASQAPYPQKSAYQPATIADVNTADTTAFIALPGIGSKLAARIVAFRDKLGGFYKVEQVADTYGLADSVYQRIKDRLHIVPGAVTKININTATIEQLKTHPYIKYALANTIVQYRNQHGPYSTVADIKKIVLVSEEVFEKVKPYLRVEWLTDELSKKGVVYQFE